MHTHGDGPGAQAAFRSNAWKSLARFGPASSSEPSTFRQGAGRGGNGPRQPVRRPSACWSRPSCPASPPSCRPRRAAAHARCWRWTLPQLSEVAAARALPATAGRSSSVRPGQTLGSLFKELDIPRATMQRMLKNAGAKAALTQTQARHGTGFRPARQRQLRTLALRPRRRPPRRAVAGRRHGQRKGDRAPTAPPAPSCSAARSARSLYRSARKAGLTSAATSTR